MRRVCERKVRGEGRGREGQEGVRARGAVTVSVGVPTIAAAVAEESSHSSQRRWATVKPSNRQNSQSC